MREILLEKPHARRGISYRIEKKVESFDGLGAPGFPEARARFVFRWSSLYCVVITDELKMRKMKCTSLSSSCIYVWFLELVTISRRGIP